MQLLVSGVHSVQSGLSAAPVRIEDHANHYYSCTEH